LSGVPEVQSAMHGAVSDWQRSQYVQGFGSMNAGAKVERGGILSFLHGKVPVFPNLQFWDYTKNSLDAMIANEIKEDGTITKKGRDLTVIVQDLRNALDKEVPQYATARQAWAGPSGFIKAINEGRTINKLSAEELSAKLQGYESDSEREAFRVGALTQVFKKMGETPTKLADLTRLVRSPEMRGKISALMPNAQAAAKWDRLLGFEIGSSEAVSQALKGSRTGRLLAEQQDASMMGELVMDAFTGTPAMSLFHKLFQGSIGRVRDTIRSRTDEEIAKILTRPGVSGLIERLGGQNAGQ
jgi:hypothetical protein